MSEIEQALDIAFEFSQIDGEHHKAWVIDQMVRVLCGDDIVYQLWVSNYRQSGEYTWDEGIAP